MWIIEKDFIAEGKLIGIKSHRFNPSNNLSYKFKLLDGDGEIYFEGVSDDLNFDPLDDFGVGYCCTEIQYKIGRRWEAL